jgi:hypothetical protein
MVKRSLGVEGVCGKISGYAPRSQLFISVRTAFSSVSFEIGDIVVINMMPIFLQWFKWSM